MVTIGFVLTEWASEAKDRELEKIALQHIKEQDRTARREARVQVQTYGALRSSPDCVTQHLHSSFQIVDSTMVSTHWSAHHAVSCR